jgi:hypothetical protein
MGPVATTHLKPEDTPCSGDRDPLTWDQLLLPILKAVILILLNVQGPTQTVPYLYFCDIFTSHAFKVEYDHKFIQQCNTQLTRSLLESFQSVCNTQKSLSLIPIAVQ